MWMVADFLFSKRKQGCCCTYRNYLLYELGIQAWLNEFQGDSFRYLHRISGMKKLYVT
jgi:hypothetical protein